MMNRQVVEPESMGILVAALIASILLFVLLFSLYVGMKVYRFKRGFDKRPGALPQKLETIETADPTNSGQILACKEPDDPKAK